MNDRTVGPVRIITARTEDALTGLDDNSVDAIVTDPPYGLEFMSLPFDSQWREATGFTKPGLGRDRNWPSFGGRDSANPSCRECGGRLRGGNQCECGDPDWHVNGDDWNPTADSIATMQRFAAWCETWGREALRVLKPGGHLLAFGATRTSHRLISGLEDAGFEVRDTIHWTYATGYPKSLDASKAIDRHLGAERPVVGHVGNPDPRTIDRRALDMGGSTGKAKNGIKDGWAITAPGSPEAAEWDGWGTALKPSHEPIVVARKPLAGTVARNLLRYNTGGINIAASRPGDRWPANTLISHHPECDQVCHPDCTIATLEQAGCPAGFFATFPPAVFVPKPAETERDAGPSNGNNHETLKPVELMRYLVRMVTPPAGTVLDLFCGSGTTLVAAVLEGFAAIGIDMNATHTAVAAERVEFAQRIGALPAESRYSDAATRQLVDDDRGQASLFDVA